MPDVTTETAAFLKSVATGELARTCAETTGSDCPWTPEGLRKAKVVPYHDHGALARVASKQGGASWLVLRRDNGVWQAVAVASTAEYGTFFLSADFEKRLRLFRQAQYDASVRESEMDAGS